VLFRSQKIGMITFGSRTDLVVPVGAAEPVVRVDQRVKGGQTAIMRWVDFPQPPD